MKTLTQFGLTQHTVKVELNNIILIQQNSETNKMVWLAAGEEPGISAPGMQWSASCWNAAHMPPCIRPLDKVSLRLMPQF